MQANQNYIKLALFPILLTFALTTVARSKILKFSVTKCPFTIPTGNRATCGYLIVPESYARPSGKKLKLFITIAKSLIKKSKHDPIIFLSGGPGYAPSTALARGGWWKESESFRKRRNFIFVDQRGTGFSQPKLNCNITTQYTDKKNYLTEVKHCYHRLVAKKINLRDFNSLNNAKDILALVSALHLKQWNIIATSYGTRVALAIMQLHSKGLRSVVLNAVMPLTPTLSVQKAINAKNVFMQLFHDCKINKLCNKSYPHLRQTYIKLIKSLPLKSTDQQQRITAPMVINALLNQMSFKKINKTPFKIHQLFQTTQFHRLNVESFRKIMNLKNSEIKLVALGMNFSVICYDDRGLVSKRAKQIIKAINQYYPYYYQTADPTCRIWGGGEALKSLQKFTRSTVPTLIFHGKYDADLTYAWAQRTANNLAHAYFYVFPGIGHDVLSDSLCARIMADAFINNPDIKPNLPCYANLTPPNF